MSTPTEMNADTRTGESRREAFARDGAVLVESFLSAEQLAEAQAVFDFCVDHPTAVAVAIAAFRQSQGLTDGPGGYGNVVDIANHAAKERLENLAATLPFGEFFADLWGSENVWYYVEELFHKTGAAAPRTLWHQDTAYMPVAGEHWANAWFSFEAVPKSNALEIIRGSHRGVQYDGTMFNRNDPTQPWHGGDSLPRLPDIEAERAADPSSYDILSWATQPGDMVVLHPKSLHGGAGLDENLPARRTLVLRFFGDDATFRELPSPSASGFPAHGGLFGEHIAHLAEGEPYRAPIFKKLH